MDAFGIWIDVKKKNNLKFESYEIMKILLFFFPKEKLHHQVPSTIFSNALDNMPGKRYE